MGGYLLIIYPVCYQADKKIKIAQALSEEAEDDFIVGLFVTMNKHVPEGCQSSISTQAPVGTFISS
jgi:hypothetical protein